VVLGALVIPLLQALPVLGASSAVQAVGPLACTDTASPGGDWPMYGHDLANTRSQPQEHTIGAGQAGSLSTSWVFSLAAAGDMAATNSTPTESGGCVFFGSSSGTVYALTADTGAVVWRKSLTVTSPGRGGGIVGAVALDSGLAYVLINQLADGSGNGPYAVALNQSTGDVVWRSPPLDSHAGQYTNASPIVFHGMVLAGFSGAESDPTGQGGLDLIDSGTGAILRRIYTVPSDRQQQGFAGGGIWSTPAVDAATGFGYVGAGNPNSKIKQDPNTDAILKYDLRSASPTFGQIVAAYPGNTDQYSSALDVLSQTPLCSTSAPLFTMSVIDDPLCGQLDLDFGAAPNLFTAGGRTVVGDLQKSGVYHVADAQTMGPVWTSIIGLPCAACNASSTATAGGRVFAEGTPGGIAFSLDQNTGGYRWLSPVADGIHYQSISVADGVVYTVDTLGFLDALDATTGVILQRRPLILDTGVLNLALSSTGVAIARHRVLVATNSDLQNGATGTGYVIAYSK
jgi:polyvinyl alcohol dehydrogenase (cytochrome)